MVPRTRLELVRISPHAPQTCAATNYATSAKRLRIQKNPLSQNFKNRQGYLLVPAFVLVVLLLPAASVGAATALFVFVSVDAAGATGAVVSVVVPVVEFKTETSPLMAGIAKSSAVSIKTAAAPIVILDRTDCVPRGPKAVLEILLVNNAPASALPGCNKTVATRTRQEIKNKTYNK